MFAQVIFLWGISKSWDVWILCPWVKFSSWAFTPFCHTCCLTFFFYPEHSSFFSSTSSPHLFLLHLSSSPFLYRKVGLWVQYLLPVVKCLFSPDCFYVSFNKVKFLWKDLLESLSCDACTICPVGRESFFFPALSKRSQFCKCARVEALKKRGLEPLPRQLSLYHAWPRCLFILGTLFIETHHTTGYFSWIYLKLCISILSFLRR